MRLVALPGDGVGPIVIDAAIDVMRAAGARLEVERWPFGLSAVAATGSAVPDATLAAVRAAGSALLGAGASVAGGPPSPILALRRALGLDLLVRPVRGGGLDAVVVGHAWAGLYREAERAPAVVTRELHEAELERLLAEAVGRARRRVSFVDKPSVFRHTAAMFERVAARLPADGIALEIVNADAFAARLVTDPGSVDVIAAESLLSDVLSDLAAALAGGVPLAASASLGAGLAVFEPVHGTAPRHAGREPPMVNPIGAIRAGAMWLAHAGATALAARVEQAVEAVLREGAVRTPDLGGRATTAELAGAIAARAGTGASGPPAR